MIILNVKSKTPINETPIKTLIAGVLLLLMLWPGAKAFGHAEFDVEYTDAPGYGFLDTTAKTPQGGNQGTTLGAQRRIALEFALNAFSARLHTTIPIHVKSNFQNFGGTSTSATLASAGPEWFNYNFPGAPHTNIAYPSALANKISGMDLSDAARGIADISLTINADIDRTALGNTKFYYGLDGLGPRFDVDFVTVIAHEIMHGLGFLSTIDPVTGHKFGCNINSCRTNTIADIFSTFLAQRNDGVSSPLLDMTQSQRLAAITADGQIIWTGAEAQANSSQFFRGTLDGFPKIYAPSPVEQGSSLSHTDMSLHPPELMQPAYTGVLNLSTLSLGMLADMGWGTLGDLAINLRESQASSSSTNRQIIAAISNEGAQTLTAVTAIINTNNGVIQLNQGNTACVNVTSREVRCQINQLLVGQITDVSFEIQGQTALALISAHVQSDILESTPANNQTTITLQYTGPSVNTTENPTANTSATPSTTTTLTPSQVAPTTLPMQDNGPAKGGSSDKLLLVLLLSLVGLVFRRDCFKLKLLKLDFQVKL